jgi:hypothetical protein
MKKITTLSLGALAMVLSTAAHAVPGNYDDFKIYYIEQVKLESKEFRKCLENAQNPQQKKKIPNYSEEVMPLESNCIDAETKRMTARLDADFPMRMSFARQNRERVQKWASKPIQPDYSYILKTEQEQGSWRDGLTQFCMKDFPLETADPKIVMPLFRSCMLTETARRLLWIERYN